MATHNIFTATEATNRTNPKNVNLIPADTELACLIYKVDGLKNIDLGSLWDASETDPMGFDPGNLNLSADHVLVVYNKDPNPAIVSESEEVKNHYVATRPGFSNVEVMHVTTTTDETISSANFQTEIATPIKDKVLLLNQQSPQTHIKFIVLCHGLPTRIPILGPPKPSVAYEIHTQLMSNPSLTSNIFVTHLTGGSVADVKGYIDRISGGTVDGVYLEGSSNSNYYIEGVK